MDTNTFANTQKYAKNSVLKCVENPANSDDVTIKEIYVVEKEHDMSLWRAVLVDSFCQAGKTKKCFEILHEKITKQNGENTLVLFVTQANSLASATQTIQRAKASSIMNTIIPSTNIYKSNKIPSDELLDSNYMIVDFWNSRNMGNMLDFVREHKYHFASIIIVIDECEQGHVKGLKERLGFVRNIEKSAPNSIVKVIFVTATVPNLSKSILQITKANELKFKTGVVSEIVNKPVVEHQFAQPHSTYVGASWFKNTPDVWRRLLFPKKTSDMTKDDYITIKEKTVMEQVKALPKSSKELTMFVTSTRTCDHSSLAERLYRSDYNVTVEMNGTNSKNFKVNYVDKFGDISTWNIPYSQIDSKADKGDLETFRNSEKKLVYTGICQKDDYTMSHILQASLFMMTDSEKRIKDNIVPDEFNKLDAISNTIMNLDKSLRRPNDYPEKPRVALIAGHLAGRGITFQNPHIDFTCTSFCFTDTRDSIQRGATNTQRFGRACGMLSDVFARIDRKPILIATEGIMKDALANEAALQEKAEEIQNGTLFSLKDMVTKDEWDKLLKKTNEELKTSSCEKKKVKILAEGEELIDGVSPTALKHYFKSKNLLVSKMIRYLYGMDKPITFQKFKDGIGYTKSDKQFVNNIQNGRGNNSTYGKLWVAENNFIQINDNIRKFIDMNCK